MELGGGAGPRIEPADDAVGAGEELVVTLTLPEPLPESAWLGVIPASVTSVEETANDDADVAYEYVHAGPELRLNVPSPASTSSASSPATTPTATPSPRWGRWGSIEDQVSIATPIWLRIGVYRSTSTPGVSIDTTREYRTRWLDRPRLRSSFHHPDTG